jgi:hypothetical protein
MALAGDSSNLFEYAASDPVNLVDPTGKFAFLLPVAIGFVQGVVIDVALQLLTNGGNFKCIDPSHALIAGGLGALGAGLGSLTTVFRPGTVWSHFVPGRYIRRLSLSGKNLNPFYKAWLDNPLGRWFVNSELNGNYVSPAFHALTDRYATLPGWTLADKLPAGIQQLLRVPGWFAGASAGSAIGASRSNGSGGTCGCQR